MPGGGVYCRATFIEILIRLAYHVNCSLVSAKDKALNEYFAVPLNKAFAMLVDDKLTKFFLDQGLDRLAFREEQLFDREVDMVFSIN